MADGTIILVHGTGVRLESYTTTFASAVWQAREAGIGARLVPCAWGDPLGVAFEGRSLPDPPEAAVRDAEAAELARWNWLFPDPLCELDQLTIPDRRAPPAPPAPPNRPPAWQVAWEFIAAYTPSSELLILLKGGGLDGLWPAAWSEIIGDPIPKQAFERSAHEIPVVARALARALVARLHTLALEARLPGPSSALRAKLVERLVQDWKQDVLGLGSFLVGTLKRRATRLMRENRHGLSHGAAFPLGDILLYQSRGEAVRAFIREKIAAARANGPVTLVAHSLGGIACFDLLALPDPPAVDRLVTVGSQAPLLYELGALSSLAPGDRLPDGFPPWLNIYDRNDLLSYVAGRLFPQAKDVAVESGQPFPDAHSAYFGNGSVWAAIRAALP
ncbi:hypothetical protein [Azospirillum thiophilum]|uniref:hypothetical protein n=1 Tax=Azospirillum thiophilum TaxID=528244 RepID=UPI000697FDCD|nr:hypothetical protein [Azospirillum thiophilum]